MGGYTYRFENVSAYVPPGHGMVYLAAIAIARSGLLLELIGIAVGAWKWAAIDPVSGLSQANSPSGVATESTMQYQNVTGGAALVLSGLRYVNAWRQAEGSSLSPVGRWTGL